MLASADFRSARPCVVRPHSRLRQDSRGGAASLDCQSKSRPGFVWNADLIAVVGSLPPGGARCRRLRALWGQAGLDEVILPYLARAARVGGQGPFSRGGLGFVAAGDGRRLSRGGLTITFGEKASTWTKCSTCCWLSDVCHPKRSINRCVTASWLACRRRRSRNSTAADDCEGLVYIRTHPDKAAHPNWLDPDGVDVAAWDKRLAKIDWSTGDAERGRQIFVKASCAACHGGSQAARGPTSPASVRASAAPTY